MGHAVPDTQEDPQHLLCPHLKTSTKHSCNTHACTLELGKGLGWGRLGAGVPGHCGPQCPIPHCPPTSKELQGHTLCGGGPSLALHLLRRLCP